MAAGLKVARQATWWGFGITHAVVLVCAGLPSVWLPLLAFGLALIFLLTLLVLYNQRLAAWRAILIAWAAYVVLRLLSAGLDQASAQLLRNNLAALTLLLSIDAMLAALAAILVLAIRRDVSVAYVTLAYALGGFLMLQMLRSAGGVFNLLTASALPSQSGAAVLIGPLVVSLSCMATLGFLSFFPHLLRLVYCELRGE